MDRKVYFVALIATCTLVVYGYPGGAPDGACNAMRPSHGGAEPKDNADTNYRFDVFTDQVEPGESVSVTLRGESRSKFKGFLIIARDSEGTARGSFEPYYDYSKPYVKEVCDGKKGLTHSLKWKNQPWHNLPFIWKAPASFEGNITFYATVIKNFNTFWVNIKGNETVTVTKQPTTTKSTSASTTTEVVNTTEVANTTSKGSTKKVETSTEAKVTNASTEITTKEEGQQTTAVTTEEPIDSSTEEPTETDKDADTDSSGEGEDEGPLVPASADRGFGGGKLRKSKSGCSILTYSWLSLVVATAVNVITYTSL